MKLLNNSFILNETDLNEETKNETQSQSDEMQEHLKDFDAMREHLKDYERKGVCPAEALKMTACFELAKELSPSNLISMSISFLAMIVHVNSGEEKAKQFSKDTLHFVMNWICENA